MNEQIRQLADQAHEYALGVYDQRIATEGPENVFFYQISNDKFAELIVRECADIAGEEDFDVMMKEGYPCSQTAKKIKEHFGIEE